MARRGKFDFEARGVVWIETEVYKDSDKMRISGEGDKIVSWLVSEEL